MILNTIEDLRRVVMDTMESWDMSEYSLDFQDLVTETTTNLLHALRESGFEWGNDSDWISYDAIVEASTGYECDDTEKDNEDLLMNKCDQIKKELMEVLNKHGLSEMMIIDYETKSIKCIEQIAINGDTLQIIVESFGDDIETEIGL